jgi:hypothetical protein
MTIEELLDIEAIRKLRANWAHYYDGKEIDKLADLFTEDAVCEFSDKYGGHWVGREAIRANYARYSPPDKPRYGGLHAGTNHVIDILGPEDAVGRWYILDFNTREGVDDPIILFGLYEDTYRKENGQWNIRRARLNLLWPTRDAPGLDQAAE